MELVKAIYPHILAMIGVLLLITYFPIFVTFHSKFAALRSRIYEMRYLDQKTAESSTRNGDWMKKGDVFILNSRDHFEASQRVR